MEAQIYSWLVRGTGENQGLQQASEVYVCLRVYVCVGLGEGHDCLMALSP